MTSIASPPWPESELAGQRTLLQIDAAYLSVLEPALGYAVDFRALRHWVQRASLLLRAFYYVELFKGDDNRRRLTDWLDYNGYALSIRTVSSETHHIGPHVAMAVDALSLVGSYDHLILMAGSDALLPVVRAVRNTGPRVTVISTLQEGAAMIGDQLRRAADSFVDAADLAPIIALSSRSGAAPQRCPSLDRPSRRTG